jgi:hypothetical protein
LSRTRTGQKLGRVKQFWQRAKAIETDSKAQLLWKFVGRVSRTDPDEKILISTEHTDTLESRRGQVFPNHDIAYVYDDLNQPRHREMTRFDERPT